MRLTGQRIHKICLTGVEGASEGVNDFHTRVDYMPAGNSRLALVLSLTGCVLATNQKKKIRNTKVNNN